MKISIIAGSVLLLATLNASANVVLEKVEGKYVLVPTGEHAISAPFHPGFDEHFDAKLNVNDGSLIAPSFREGYELDTSKTGFEPRINAMGFGESQEANSSQAFPYEKNANYSITADFSETYNSTLEIKNLDEYLVQDGITPDAIFASYYVKIDHLSGEKSRNIKLLRLTSGYNGGYLQPTVGVTIFHNTNSAIFYNYYGSGDHNLKWVKVPPMNQWVRLDYYVKMSSSKGTSDGAIALYYNGEKITELTDVVTNNTDNFFEWATLPYYVAKDPGGVYEMHSDSLAILPSYRRIEACMVKDFRDAQDYSDCENPVVLAPHSVETNSGIGLTHEKLIENNVEKLILYYFDSENNLINPKGIHFCPRCPS